MKYLLLSLSLLLAGPVHAWEYQRNAMPLPLPGGYQKPTFGQTISRFDRKARAPYWDTTARCLVIECCMPSISRNGVSHFYTFVYTISADGKSMTRTRRMWNSHKTDAEPMAVTYTMTTDTPFHFNRGRVRYIVSVDSEGVITSIRAYGYNTCTGKDLPPEGCAVYPSSKAPSIVHNVF